MKKLLIFVIFLVGLIGLPAVQAEELTATVNVKSHNVSDTGTVFFDKPALHAGIHLTDLNGWCGELTGSVGLDDTNLLGSNFGDQVSATICRDWKFNQYNIQAGLTYNGLYQLNIVRPYVAASMPIGKNMSVFARGDVYYIVGNGNDGNTLAVGATLGHSFVGLGATHELRAVRDNTSFDPNGKGNVAMYDMTLSWEIEEGVIVHPLKVQIIDRENALPVTVYAAGLTITL